MLLLVLVSVLLSGPEVEVVPQVAQGPLLDIYLWDALSKRDASDAVHGAIGRAGKRALGEVDVHLPRHGGSGVERSIRVVGAGERDGFDHVRIEIAVPKAFRKATGSQQVRMWFESKGARHWRAIKTLGRDKSVTIVPYIKGCMVHPCSLHIELVDRRGTPTWSWVISD